jgi:OOP family OmpA-OmpF porin
MGGFDIFRSKINHELFLYPRNLGFPLNSSSDNLNWVPLGKWTNRLYTRNITQRKWAGLIFGKSGYPKLPDIPRFVISGNAKTIGDSINDAAEIKVCLTNIKNKTADSLNSIECGNMRFEFKKPSGSYELEASANGYNTMKKFIFLDPEQLESEFNFNLTLEKPAERVKPRTIELRTIFFSFNSRTLNSGYYAMLDSIAILLLDFPSLHLYITGHTDGKGSKAYNNTLSLQRSESVMNYLSSKNIDTARLKCLGEGSLKPIALEKTRNGKDLSSGRLWNRRVELRFSSNDQILIKTIVPFVPERLRMDKQPNLE